MQMGVKNRYVFAGNVAIDDDSSTITDNFRRLFGRYWISSDEGINYGRDSYGENWNRRLGLRVLFRKANTYESTGAPFYTKVQEVILQGDPAKWNSQQLSEVDWDSFVKFVIPSADGPTTNVRNTDISFVMHTPIDTTKGETFGDGSGLGNFKVDFEYNFFVANYENVIRGMPENLLPSIYAILSEGLGKPSKNMRSLLTMAGQMPRAKARIAKIAKDYYEKGLLDREKDKKLQLLFKSFFCARQNPNARQGC